MLKHKRLYALAGTTALIAVLAVGAQHVGRRPVTIPEQTALRVTISHSIASNTTEPGEHFSAIVADPVVVNGKTVIPHGAEVIGRIVDAHASGWFHGRARLNLVLESVDVNGKSYAIHTARAARLGGAHRNRDVALLGGGAGGGALIGALAAGGKGALIGAPIGAGAGAAGLLLTGRKDIRIPAETSLTFRLTEPVAIG